MDATTMKKYTFLGISVGYITLDSSGRRYFYPLLDDTSLFDLVNMMDQRTRVHMRREAYGVYRALQSFNCNPDDFVRDEDVAIHVMHLGAHSLTQLYRKDHRAWELVKQRNLATIIFQEHDAPIADIGLGDSE